MQPLTWTEFGFAGLVALSLGPVIGYMFRLLNKSQQAAVDRANTERDNERIENTRLHTQLEDMQRAVLATLADVARVMGEVQQMLRERETQRAVERELDRGRERP